MIWNVFSRAYLAFVYPVWWGVCSGLWPVLPDVSFENILSQNVAFSFSVFQCLSVLFSFLMNNALGVGSKKSLPYSRSSRFFSVSSRSFIVLHFASRSVIQYELIFVKRCRVFVQVHFLLFAHGCPVSASC